MKQRKQAATLAEQIIETETEVSWKMIQGEIYNADIGQIYQQTEDLRRQELSKFLSSMDHLPLEDRQAIENMTRALTQKLLHHPITVAKNCAREAEYDRLRFLLQAMTIPSDKNPTKK